MEEPEAAEGVMTQPVAVPVLEKSAAVRPLTGSEKESEYESEAALAGDEGEAVKEAVGAVRSIDTEAACSLAAGPRLPD
jgi:hypothetical protein